MCFSKGESFIKKITMVVFLLLIFSATIFLASCGQADEKAMEPIDELLAEIPEEEILVYVGTHDISEEAELVKSEALKIGAEYSVTIKDKDGNNIPMNDETFTVAEGQTYTVTLYIKLNKVERTKTVTLRAADNFTVTFDVNGGTETGTIPYIQEVVEEEDIALPTPPTRTNYIFDGWDPEPILHDITSDATYTATWIQTYALTFNPNGGSAVSSIRVYPSYTAPIPISEREGYYFDKWYRDSNLTLPFSVSSITADTALYAKWIMHLGTPTYNGVEIPEQGEPNVYIFEYPASTGPLVQELLQAGSPPNHEFTYMVGALPDMSSGYGEVGITVMDGDQNIGAILVILQAVTE